MTVKMMWLGAFGVGLCLWSGYELVRAYRTGDISAIGPGTKLEAGRDDPRIWFWLIVGLDAGFFLGGLGCIASTLSAL